MKHKRNESAIELDNHNQPTPPRRERSVSNIYGKSFNLSTDGAGKNSKSINDDWQLNNINMNSAFARLKSLFRAIISRDFS